MDSEKTFDQAVRLAAAFIANGDIRLGGNTRSDTEAQAMLADLIPTLYQTLSRARGNVGLPPRAE